MKPKTGFDGKNSQKNIFLFKIYGLVWQYLDDRRLIRCQIVDNLIKHYVSDLDIFLTLEKISAKKLRPSVHAHINIVFYI